MLSRPQPLARDWQTAPTAEDWKVMSRITCSYLQLLQIECTRGIGFVHTSSLWLEVSLALQYVQVWVWVPLCIMRTNGGVVEAKSVHWLCMRASRKCTCRAIVLSDIVLRMMLYCTHPRLPLTITVHLASTQTLLLNVETVGHVPMYSYCLLQEVVAHFAQ
eukprot:6489122-Amphidinium_carterae.1